jgi:hypothetical protein
MSNNNEIVRDKYFNYGSYLRSRGYDKDIGSLVTSIENGEVAVGTFTPGNCGSNGAVYVNSKIRGNVDINVCDVGGTDGQLSVNGGTAVGSIPNRYGLQVYNGSRILGPIYQQTDTSHDNAFYARQHLFSSMDASTNFVIRGSLSVTGPFTYLTSNALSEALEISTQTGASGESLKIYHSSTASKNIMNVYVQSKNIVVDLIGNDQWHKHMAFCIDGTNAGSNTYGSTDTQGHVRMFRGATVTNTPDPTTGVPDPDTVPASSYRRDLNGTDVALDVYGGIYVNPGFNGHSGKIDVKNGTISMRNNSTVKILMNGSTGDAAFSGRIVTEDISTNTTIIQSLTYRSTAAATRTSYGAYPVAMAWNGSINTSSGIAYATGGYTPTEVAGTNSAIFQYNVTNLGARYFTLDVQVTTAGVAGNIVCYVGLVDSTQPLVTLTGLYTPSNQMYVPNISFMGTNRKTWRISDVFDMNSVAFQDTISLRIYVATDYNGGGSQPAFSSGTWNARLTPIIKL